METAARFGAVPRTAIVLALIVLLTALAGIALAVGASEDGDPNGRIALDVNGDIWTVRPDGSDRRQLTSGPEVDLSPQWSPDGSLIAFWSWPELGVPERTLAAYDALFARSPASLVVIDAHGGDRRVLADGLVLGNGLANPMWAPDNRRLAYSRVEGTSHLVDVVGIDGRATTVPGEAAYPTWSPDGKRLAFQGRDAGMTGSGAFVALADGTERRLVTTQPGSGFAFISPAWSPDGQWLLVQSGPDGGHDIWVVAADGGGEIEVAGEPEDEYSPTWSPDGTRIAFGRVVDPANNLMQVVIAHPDGSQPVMLDSEPLFAAAPAWSPDGTRALGWVPDADQEWATHLIMFDVTGETDPARVETGGDTWGGSWGHTPGSATPASWTPDGSATDQATVVSFEPVSADPLRSAEGAWFDITVDYTLIQRDRAVLAAVVGEAPGVDDAAGCDMGRANPSGFTAVPVARGTGRISLRVFWRGDQKGDGIGQGDLAPAAVIVDRIDDVTGVDLAPDERYCRPFAR